MIVWIILLERESNRIINLEFFWSSSIGIKEAGSKVVNLDLDENIWLLKKRWERFCLSLFVLYSRLKFV